MEIGRATNVIGTIAMIILFLWTIVELLSIYAH